MKKKILMFGCSLLAALALMGCVATVQPPVIAIPEPAVVVTPAVPGPVVVDPTFVWVPGCWIVGHDGVRIWHNGYYHRR